MFAAPLNMKPPPISRTELYIFRLVSSVAVKNKKFDFRTRRRWTDRIYVKRKNWRSIDYRSVTYHSNWCYVGLLGLDPSFSQKQASCLCYQSLWRLQCPDHVLGLARYLVRLWNPQICWIDPGFSVTRNRKAREITQYILTILRTFTHVFLKTGMANWYSRDHFRVPKSFTFKTFFVKKSFISMKIKIYYIFFPSMASHLASLWQAILELPQASVVLVFVDAIPTTELPQDS